MPKFDLSNLFPLDASLVAHYREKGWVHVPGLCRPDEIAHYRQAIVDAARRLNRETRPIEERDTYGRAFLQIMNLWVQDDEVRPYTLARRFGHVAAQLTGAAGVRLYHDQALFKEPGGGHTPWHQDQFYWPLATSEAITMWMPLVDITAEMGSMTFASGSQREGFVEIYSQISYASEAFFDGWVRDRGYALAGAGAMRAGDATFHSGWTLHRAPGNVTDRVREVMTVIYYPDGTLIHPPENDFQRADHEAWLGGGAIGAPAEGPLNPVVYNYV